MGEHKKTEKKKKLHLKICFKTKKIEELESRVITLGNEQKEKEERIEFLHKVDTEKKIYSASKKLKTKARKQQKSMEEKLFKIEKENQILEDFKDKNILSTEEEKMLEKI